MLVYSSCQSEKSNNEHELLHAIFDKEWAFRIADNPFLATYSGVKEYNAKLPDVSIEAQQKRAEFWGKLLQELAVIDRELLSKEDQINYDIFRYQLEDAIAGIGFESYLLPFNSEGGFITDFYYMVKSMPFDNKNDVENYLKRLSAFDTYVNQHIDLMKLGLEKKKTQPKAIMEPYQQTLNGLQVEEIEKHPYYAPFLKQPISIGTNEWQTYQLQAKEIIKTTVTKSVNSFATFMHNIYVPGCRESLGISEIPNGKAFYQQRVAYFTTTNNSADEVFQIGQQEVARIRARMEKTIADLKFEGSFADFLTFLRTDARFYASSARELLKEAAYLSKKMDGKLPDYFNHLPRLPYGVSPVPEAIAPTYTTGRYSEGSLPNHKSGTYWVNTYNLKSRPLYSLPALTLHEAVPGHHLQISLAQELNDIPDFRRNTYLSCYGEGWGLYAEYLGEEAGMYETPYHQFGRLTYEMWRACRLVVDVGIHMKGWTREQAVDFMASNTALSIHNVNTEINRYIGWPGQALSYKMGELKILELRRKAEQALGTEFDLRAFHDVILGSGAVPLFVLEQLVDAYIKKAVSLT